ncbi:unnamed protein product [Adineta steineri]|uniref:Uncharacterized protein n=1 Tax=Adineta steineri TaxID=433720 RepID=A0A815K321_9BILA|nr:unnamed protein product [Adineta steineri]
MGNAAAVNNVGGNVLPPIKNYSVTLCEVETSAYHIDSIYVLPVLAVFIQHGFEIKPLVGHMFNTKYFCQLRQGVQPWSSEILDQAMRNALPDLIRHKTSGFRWTFA